MGAYEPTRKIGTLKTGPSTLLDHQPPLKVLEASEGRDGVDGRAALSWVPHSRTSPYGGFRGLQDFLGCGFREFRDTKEGGLKAEHPSSAAARTQCKYCHGSRGDHRIPALGAAGDGLGFRVRV